EVRLAESRVAQADAQVASVRAGALPQLNANLGYSRTFASAFSGGGGFQLPDSLRFQPDADAPLEERVAYLERTVPFAALGGLGQAFGNLPFGQANAYNVGISGSQLLYSGGRIGAALAVARDYRETARIALRGEQANIALQVRGAYYQALLAGQLEIIASAALTQAGEFTEQERLRFKVGRASELDVLRAEVAEANLRPQLVQARNAADLALLNLKRLSGLPLTQPVQLTTPLAVPPADQLRQLEPSPEFAAAQQAAVEAAERQVSIAEQGVRIARGAYLPNVSLTFNYGRQLFPSSPFDLGGDWRTDFSAGVGVQMPIFNGGRTGADVRLAQQSLEQSRLQLAQLREITELRLRQAQAERARASAEISARQQTVTAAERVYNLTRLRYQQGLATQLEVSDARLALLQARVNLAQALTSFYAADAQLLVSGAGGAATQAATQFNQPRP
ncbi:MAG: TolC family protein, partial [Gemmatimonadota bacterium]|nr:TolC family protein [Gemmatimonadota bacterium]